MSRYSRKKASGVYAGEGIYTGQGIYAGQGQGVFAAGRTSKGIRHCEMYDQVPSVYGHPVKRCKKYTPTMMYPMEDMYGEGVYTRRGTPKNATAAKYNPWIAYLKTSYVRDQFPAFREQFLRDNPRPQYGPITTRQLRRR